MLIALTDEKRIEAWVAEKGRAYICPNCRADLILKKGQIVTHHFAHKPPVTCSWAKGETAAHLAAKKLLHDGFAARGLRVEVEAVVLSEGGDRRADVLVTGRNGSRVAFEVQHQPIDFGAIERRTKAYMAAGVPVVWVSLIDAATLARGEATPTGRVVNRYSVRPWEKWAHAYGMGEIWFVAPETGEIWRGVLKPQMIEVEHSTWYSPEGEEQSAGGYSRFSKRWKTLHLTGPFTVRSVGISPSRRQAWATKQFAVPAGVFAKLTVPKA